jgi:hypothetical protein
MAKWTKTEQQLKKNHGWRSKEGYTIFVADRGAVRFDFPEDWVVTPGPDSIRFNDQPPPNDNCLLQMSMMRLPPGIDWSGLPLTQLLPMALAGDDRGVISQGEVVYVKRPDLELAWVETRFIDATERREACSRACLARGANIQPLITFDFWLDDAERLTPVWDEVLRTLRLGEYVDINGPVLH